MQMQALTDSEEKAYRWMVESKTWEEFEARVKEFMAGGDTA